MEEMIAKIVDKCGLSEEQARTVANFIVEHIDDIPGWIGKSGLADKVPGLDKVTDLF